MARPGKLNAETVETIVQRIRVAAPVTAAAEAAGVSRETYYAWLERGNSTRPADKPYREFRLAIEQALAESEAALVQRLQNAAAKGSWQAAQYLLEQRHSDNWGKPQNDTGTSGEAVKATRGEEILDELAAQRKRKAGAG